MRDDCLKTRNLIFKNKVALATAFLIYGYLYLQNLNTVHAIEAKENTGIYLGKIIDNQVTLYDPWLEYRFSTGHFPCGRPEASLIGLSDKDQQQYIKRRCNIDLYTYGRDGVEKLQIQSISIVKEDFCGDIAPKIIANVIAPKSPALFVTSIKPTTKNAGFVSSNDLRLNEQETEQVKRRVKLNIGQEKEISAIYHYRYGAWKYLLKLTSTQDLQGDPDKGQRLGKTTWNDFFLTDLNQSKQITPEDIYQVSYYGEVKEFLGLHYLGTEQRPELLFGYHDEVALMVLGNRYNFLVFPFVSPGGC